MNNIKIAEMRRKGEILFRTALNEGGTLSLGEVADLLNIPSSDAQERVENKSLLAVHFDGKLQFPMWQFVEAETIEELSDILSILKEFSADSAVLFFVGMLKFLDYIYR